MNPLLIYISPLLVLLFTAALTFATTTKLRRNRTLAFIGLAVSMVLNTLFLIYPTELMGNLETEILSANSTNIWIVELILMVGFYNFMAVDTELQDTQSKPLVSGLYLLFLAMMVGIFLTENFLFIVVFFISASILLNSLYYFGDQKQAQSRSMLRTHSIISGVSYLLLMFTVLLMYFEVRSFDFDVFLTYFPGASHRFQILFSIGCFLGFGLPTGMVFLTGAHFRKFFDKANSVFLRLRISLFVPLSGIVIIRILAQIPFVPILDLLTTFFHFAALLSVLFFSFMIILEVFGKSRQKTRSLSKILGLLGLLQGNLILLLGFGEHYVGSSEWFSYLSNEAFSIPGSNIGYLELMLTIIFVNLFLVGSLSRVFTKNSTPELHDLGVQYKPQPPFVLLLLMAICVLICPGFFGFQYIVQSLPGTLENGATVLWMNLGAFILLGIVELTVIGTLLSEIYLKPKKLNPSPQTPSQPLNLMPPLFLFVILIALSILALQISDLKIFQSWL